MADIADLLREREIRGLRGALIARITVVLITLVVEFFIFGTVFELVVTVAVMLAIVVVGVVLLRLLGRGVAPTPVGIAAVAIDIVVVATLPFVWLISVGGTDAVPWSFTVKGGLITVMVLLIAVNGVALRPLYPIIATVGATIVYLGFVAAALADPRTQLTRDYFETLMGPAMGTGMTIANVAMILVVGAIISLTTVFARRLTIAGVRLEKSNAQLGRYFSPAVRDEISAASDTFLEPGGEEQVVAVLFADIRNFTGMSEAMSPQEVLSLLSDYQSRMVEAVFAHGGTLDKFIGDAVMATFGTPRPAADDAQRAVHAGIAMRRALAELNRERAAEGLAEIRHGIGIHIGPAIVGNVGTPERLEYTVIGDTVNQASRIADACKTTGDDLLISDAVRARLDGAVAVRPIEPMHLSGKAEPVAMYAVEGAAGPA